MQKELKLGYDSGADEYEIPISWGALKELLDAYNVPDDAEIEYGDCGSHQIVITWETK